MDGRHHTAYRLLFSQPRMVRDLLRGFLREEWTAWLDLDTLERLGGSAAEPPPARRGEVPVWRLCWQGGADWIYLLLKFEAEEDPCMAPRMELYRQLLYRDLLRRRRTARPRLPVTLPIVVYHGAARWQTPREAVELFLPLPPALQRHVPRTRYLLLDVGHDPLPEGAGDDNLVSLLCQLERSRTAAAVDYLLEELMALLARLEDERLRQAWSAFLQASFLPRRFPHLFTAVVAAGAEPGGVLA